MSSGRGSCEEFGIDVSGKRVIVFGNEISVADAHIIRWKKKRLLRNFLCRTLVETKMQPKTQLFDMKAFRSGMP